MEAMVIRKVLMESKNLLLKI